MRVSIYRTIFFGCYFIHCLAAIYISWISCTVNCQSLNQIAVCVRSIQFTTLVCVCVGISHKSFRQIKVINVCNRGVVVKFAMVLSVMLQHICQIILDFHSPILFNAFYAVFVCIGRASCRRPRPFPLTFSTFRI